MSKPTEKLIADAARLRREVADTEALLGGLRAKLARIEAKLNGDPAPETGLDRLWKAALPKCRTRSSPLQCRQEWNRIPKHERPSLQVAVDALYIWNRCDEWKADGNAYVPGLHRWIKARQWENLPEVSEPSSRYRSTPKAVPQTAPEDAATPEEIAAIFDLMKPRRMNS